MLITGKPNVRVPKGKASYATERPKGGLAEGHNGKSVADIRKELILSPGF